MDLQLVDPEVVIALAVKVLPAQVLFIMVMIDQVLQALMVTVVQALMVTVVQALMMVVVMLVP